MSEQDKPLREQIVDGMEKIRHQIDLLHSGPTIGGPSDDRSVIADLETEYEGLRDALARLGPND